MRLPRFLVDLVFSCHSQRTDSDLNLFISPQGPGTRDQIHYVPLSQLPYSTDIIPVDKYIRPEK